MGSALTHPTPEKGHMSCCSMYMTRPEPTPQSWLDGRSKNGLETPCSRRAACRRGPYAGLPEQSDWLFLHDTRAGMLEAGAGRIRSHVVVIIWGKGKSSLAPVESHHDCA